MWWKLVLFYLVCSEWSACDWLIKIDTICCDDDWENDDKRSGRTEKSADTWIVLDPLYIFGNENRIGRMNMYSVQGYKPVDMSYSFWKSSHLWVHLLLYLTCTNLTVKSKFGFWIASSSSLISMVFSCNQWSVPFSEQWLMEKSELLKGRAEDLKIYTEEEYQKILIFFCNSEYNSLFHSLMNIKKRWTDFRSVSVIIQW